MSRSETCRGLIGLGQILLGIKTKLFGFLSYWILSIPKQIKTFCRRENLTSYQILTAIDNSVIAFM